MPWPAGETDRWTEPLRGKNLLYIKYFANFARMKSTDNFHHDEHCHFRDQPNNTANTKASLETP
jgi:hypothetical protein